MSETAPGPAPAPSLVMTQLLGGFQVSQALYVVTKLDICTMLEDGPLSVGELAERSGARPQQLSRLVRTLAMLGLFRTDGEFVETTPLGALLSRRHPATLANVAEMWMETHYGPFGELLHTVRTGEPGANRYFGMPAFEWLGEKPERTEQMARAMTDLTGSMRRGMFDGYDLPPGQTVADIGGSDGSLLAELIAARPDRHGIVFDLPEVVPHATAAMAERGLADRVDAVGGDFFEAVPTADIYLMSQILHDWDDESAAKILRTVCRAAGPAARLLVVEGVIPPGDAPHHMKMVDLTMLGMLPGRERTAEEYAQLLGANGFTLDRIVATPSPYSIIEATAS
ncbi:methyltransferase [Streptomyces canus]|uniref:methyltransferase n=1 Tax=Streptomyces canus TaxID=58343 RepID=UPI0003A14FCE|nr:methyltransferase [Streptomyces canus]